MDTLDASEDNFKRDLSIREKYRVYILFAMFPSTSQTPRLVTDPIVCDLGQHFLELIHDEYEHSATYSVKNQLLLNGVNYVRQYKSLNDLVEINISEAKTSRHGYRPSVTSIVLKKSGSFLLLGMYSVKYLLLNQSRVVSSNTDVL